MADHFPSEKLIRTFFAMIMMIILYILFLNFTKISTFEAVFSTDTLLFTPKVELLFSHALRKYENVVLEKYLSPSPELSKSAERSECSFSMRMKSNSAPKQILVTTSPELGKWESCPVTLKSFLDTL